MYRRLSAHFSVMALSIGLIGMGVFLRLVPHAPNFSPTLAIALFAGLYLRPALLKTLVPLLGLVFSDLFLETHSTMEAVYISTALAALLGWWLEGHKRFWVSRAVAAFAVSVLFFVLTNFAVWYAGEIYPRTQEGLVDSFVLALPFFHQTLTSTFLYLFTLEGLRMLARALMGVHVVGHRK